MQSQALSRDDKEIFTLQNWLLSSVFPHPKAIDNVCTHSPCAGDLTAYAESTNTMGEKEMAEV